jgi:hypothetical protein
MKKLLCGVAAATALLGASAAEAAVPLVVGVDTASDAATLQPALASTGAVTLGVAASVGAAAMAGEAGAAGSAGVMACGSAAPVGMAIPSGAAGAARMTSMAVGMVAGVTKA